MSQQIIFDYTGEQQSAPISADWALELGLFDCETHIVNERMYPQGCADDVAEAAEASINPLLKTEPASAMGFSPTLLIVVALLALAAGAAHFLSPKGKADATANQ